MNAVPSGVAMPTAGPWGADQRVTLAVGWVLGVAMAVLGWWGTSGEAIVEDQLPWVALSAMGVMVAGAFGALWLLAGRRAVGLRCRDSIPAPEVADDPVTVDLRAVSTVNGTNGDGFVAAARMRYFHRSDCLLARGKALRSAERIEHVEQGRIPCEVCRP
ncbi:MAG TPA: hypothetical protein VGL92_13355 [Acidimicrobiia bacterium]|jgi:hypothetical protein